MASFFSPSSDPVAGSVAGGTASLAASSPSIASTTAAIVPNTPKERPPIDVGLLLGLAIAGVAIIAGVASTGINLGYFFQPTGALIVLGGTFGVILISSPPAALARALRRVAALLRPASPSNPGALVEEILSYSRMARHLGILRLEPAIARTRHPFLRQVLALALDVRNREEFRTALDVMLRARERQGEMDAKVLETAGGFAPTIGVLGTVVGLIDALRHFSDLAIVGTAVATAFVSTLYGLALANLLLLPAAHRIRTASEDDAQADELIAEGSLGIYDSIHPTLLRDRLNGFLRNPDIGHADRRDAVHDPLRRPAGPSVQ
jgi:chemotaxis protein MotA